jgi:hypothetical protein
VTRRTRCEAWHRAETEQKSPAAAGISQSDAGGAGRGRWPLRAGVDRLLYPDCGDRWIEEDVPLDPPVIGRANQAAEAQAGRFTRAGGNGVVLPCPPDLERQRRQPLTRQAFHQALADALGVKTPIGTGTTLLRLNSNTRFYLRSQRISNRRFKEATGWAPRYPDAGAGWRPWSPRQDARR